MENSVYSIYHFFAHLYRNRKQLAAKEKLSDFAFDAELLSYEGAGRFPDLAIRVNPENKPPGGELVELKDSRSYSVSSFNSTIPSGVKAIADITGGKSNVLREGMLARGDDIHALPERDVFYLVRGRKNGNMKICLVHGSFFETVPVDELIQGSFTQALNERLQEEDEEISEELRALITGLFSRQDTFSKVRHVKNASVRLRFRVMTEVNRQGNILSSRSYPKIKDNTISLVLPYKTEAERAQQQRYIRMAISKSEWEVGSSFTICHPLNGKFLVLSYAL
ncbi:MAG: hypothetical protein OXE95_07330 [Chloroflexi bacterium]|nr:hypothetical protein [Chloroflexota bacterium]MCY4247367.1 hypothetical protein [Chloroflexota bacterium]